MDSGLPEGRGVDEQDASASSIPLGRDVALYTMARFGLVAVVAAVLAVLGVPVLLGVAVGLIIGFPLTIVLLPGWHGRVSAGLAARSASRAAQRDRLRAQLRGELGEELEEQ